jgi:hypothetical protein
VSRRYWKESERMRARRMKELVAEEVFIKEEQCEERDLPFLGM